MTLLVVLGVVVIATVLAALYLSLKSGRGNEPTSDGAGGGDRLAGGGSRSGRSASLADRVRSMADRGKAARSSRRRAGDDDDEYDVPDYVTARRASRSAGGGDRSSLVAAGTDQRTAGARAPAGFDDTDPALHVGYGHSAAGYDGYDAVADTRVSGPMASEPGTGPYATGGYDAAGFDTGTGPMPGYSEPPRGYRDRAGERGQDAGERGQDAGERGRAGERRQDADSSRGQYRRPTREGTGGPAAGDFGGPAARTPRGHGRPGGRRRASASDPARPSDHDDAPTALADSPFSSPSGQDFPAEDAGESSDGSRSGRRLAKIQKPQLRIGRSRQDYDNDPWPSADEVDGISDDQFWSDLSSDKPLATTARTAQSPGDSGQPWAPGDSPGRPGVPGGHGRPGGHGGPTGPDSSDMVSAPVPADAPPMERGGRRARRRAAEPEDGTAPRPRQQPDRGPGGPGGPGGSRRRGEPAPSPRGADEDPLTSASFSRHAREASDSRSYRGSREAHRPSHGRPDASTDETQTMRADPRGYGAPGPAGAPASSSSRRGAQGPGGRPGSGGRPGPGSPSGAGSALPPVGPGGYGGPSGYGAPSGPYPSGSPSGAGSPSGPNAPTGPNTAGGPAGRRDPYGDSGYRNGARPAGSYPESTGGYEPPARGSRHASPPGGSRPPAGGTRPPAGGTRPPAASGPPPPRPGPASGAPSYPNPSYPGTGGSSAYPGPGSNGSSPYSGSNGSSAYPGPGSSGNTPYPGTNGTSAHPGTNGSSAYPGPGSNGNTPYPGTYGDSALPEGSGGTGGYPRGRRSSNRDSRRPDDPYDDPYGRPDDTRY